MSRRKRNNKRKSQRPFLLVKGNKFEIDSEHKVVYIKKIGADLSHREKAKVYAWARSYSISDIRRKTEIISLIQYCDVA